MKDGDRVTERIKFSEFWDEDDFFRDGDLPVKIPSIPNDVRDLYADGIPAWVAPNIFLFKPRVGKSGDIEIGEDRDDNILALDREIFSVVQLKGNAVVLVNSSFHLFLEAILAYAKMIEEGIRRNGRKAAQQNKLPDDLVMSFKSELFSIDKLAIENGNFWAEEISRLLSHIDC